MPRINAPSSPEDGTRSRGTDRVAAGEREKLHSAADAAEAAIDTRWQLPNVKVRRPDDLFVAELSFYNMRLTPGSPPMLARAEAGTESVLVVELPPQSFGEEAFLEATGPEVKPQDDKDFERLPDPEHPELDNKNVAVEEAEPIPPLGGTRLRMSGPSRLAFNMPADVTSLPYTLDALLAACRTWPVRKSFSAAIDPEPFGNRPAGRADVLNTMVTSDEFVSTLRSLKSSMGMLATPAAVTAITAAGGRIATIAAATLRSADPLRAGAVIDAAVRAETVALAKQLPATANGNGSALATVALQYEAVSQLAKMGLVGNTGFSGAAAVPLLPLLSAPYRPSRKATALELPYRLVTSPINAARWTHRTTAVAQQGRHELWHTRLTTGAASTGPDKPTKLRAIWSEDYLLDQTEETTGLPFNMPLDAQDRRMLVQLTTGFDEETSEHEDYFPRPFRATRVMLSALGGSLDSEGAWATRPDGVDIEQWRHQMSLGRDHYVRVVYAGFLLPFGHAASLIKITERKFEPADTLFPQVRRVAALRQRFFIVVREPVKTFDGSYHVHDGHPFPFTSVELLTRVTPKLLRPDDCKASEEGGLLYRRPATLDGGVSPRQLFWPMLSDSPADGDFRFDIAAIDRDGRRVTFAMPLLFMSEVANTGSIKPRTEAGPGQPLIANVIKAYNLAGPTRRKTDTGGASICFAPPDPGALGDPRMPTSSLTFRAGEVKQPRSNTRVNTYPEVEEASVALLAAQRILGSANATVTVQYYDMYATGGFGGGNTGEVFLAIKGDPWPMEFGANASSLRTDVVGAIASPSTRIEGVSRRMGLAGNLIQVTQDRFVPTAFFGDAKILGNIRLSDILPLSIPGVDSPDAPKFVTRDLPTRTEASYDWKTTLTKPDPAHLLLPSPSVSNPTQFHMTALTVTPIGAPESVTTTADAKITNFKVNLFEFIVLSFRELRFITVQGKKPEVVVDMDPMNAVAFGGPLEFVNGLKDLLPGNGFSDPAALQVTGSGIEAKYSLGIPSVQVGIFALSGLSIGARFSLPFDTKPVEVGFNFAERENPFSLTVSLLGGGGFMAIGVGADGVREIEAALEAGARLAIDLGVASGAVEIKAGIYFHWLTPDDVSGGLVELAGYVRVHGELDVMGIISVSITFNLQLAYTKKGRESVIWGEASVIVEIEVLVFSGEVTVRCRREFGGSEADPTFAQLMPGDNVWAAYCSAFAEA